MQLQLDISLKSVWLRIAHSKQKLQRNAMTEDKISKKRSEKQHNTANNTKKRVRQKEANKKKHQHRSTKH